MTRRRRQGRLCSVALRYFGINGQPLRASSHLVVRGTSRYYPTSPPLKRFGAPAAGIVLIVRFLCLFVRGPVGRGQGEISSAELSRRPARPAWRVRALQAAHAAFQATSHLLRAPQPPGPLRATPASGDTASARGFAQVRRLTILERRSYHANGQRWGLGVIFGPPAHDWGLRAHTGAARKRAAASRAPRRPGPRRFPKPTLRALGPLPQPQPRYAPLRA